MVDDRVAERGQGSDNLSTGVGDEVPGIVDPARRVRCRSCLSAQCSRGEVSGFGELGTCPVEQVACGLAAGLTRVGERRRGLIRGCRLRRGRRVCGARPLGGGISLITPLDGLQRLSLRSPRQSALPATAGLGEKCTGWGCRSAIRSQTTTEIQMAAVLVVFGDVPPCLPHCVPLLVSPLSRTFTYGFRAFMYAVWIEPDRSMG